MKSNRAQGSGMGTRQKVIAGIFVVVLIIIIWQIIGLFGGGSSSTPTPAPAKTGAAMSANAPGGATTSNQPGQPGQPQMQMPQAAQLTQKPEAMSQRELQLLQMQQETQAKYVAALNELQMLRINRDIAETNQAIAAAKLATVTAEKGVVDLLAPKPTTPIMPPGGYAQAVSQPKAGPTPPLRPAQPAQEEVNYTVVSVSMLEYKWHAVLGYGGSLYNVMVGDVLPADGSKVEHISRNGVVLEKNGVKKKVSLVPII